MDIQESDRLGLLDEQGNLYWLKEMIVVIGRKDGCDIVLSSSLVSRVHAVVCFTHLGWRIRDLGSTNGIYLDGKKISPDQSEPIFPSVKVSVGGYSLSVLNYSDAVARSRELFDRLTAAAEVSQIGPAIHEDPKPVDGEKDEK